MSRERLMRVEYARGLSISYAAEHFTEFMVRHRRGDGYRRLLGQMLRNSKEMHQKASVVNRIQR